MSWMKHSFYLCLLSINVLFLLSVCSAHLQILASTIHNHNCNKLKFDKAPMIYDFYVHHPMCCVHHHPMTCARFSPLNVKQPEKDGSATVKLWQQYLLFWLWSILFFWLMTTHPSLRSHIRTEGCTAISHIILLFLTE